jgi:hypothetical protein
MKRVKVIPCSACGNLPTYEKILDNHNRNYYLYNCPICEPDGPARETLRKAAICWNKRNTQQWPHETSPSGAKE